MSSPGSTLATPYPGLRPFKESDHPIFFGREAQVIAMMRHLASRRFLGVVGSSGSGKSSLVMAGLLPAVRRGFLAGTKEKDWLIVPPIRPGSAPYRNLADTLMSGFAKTADERQGSAAPLLEVLRESDQGLLEVLSTRPEPHVMLVVDQFEELFAFRRPRQTQADELAHENRVAPRDESAAFVSMLLRTCAERNGRVWLILTMRSDFIGDCEAFLGLPEKVSESQFLVPRLDRSQMAEAICGPSQVKKQGYSAFDFAEGLVNHIINEAGDRPDQLPLMQHALMCTWKNATTNTGKTGSPRRLSFDNYRDAGGIRDALNRHAETALLQIEGDRSKAAIARTLFLLLCDVAPDGQITRRRPSVREVMKVANAPLKAVEEVVRVFQSDDRNFLLPYLGKDDHGKDEHLRETDELDISHEALLRQWKQFANIWLIEERRNAAELRLLVERAKDLEPPSEKYLNRVWSWQQDIATEWTSRYVTKDDWTRAKKFLEESRSVIEAKRRKGLLLRYGWQLAILGALLIMGWLLFQASEERSFAQKALTTSFTRTIGVSNDPSVEEHEALWDLAALDSGEVRRRVIEKWLSSVDLATKGLRREARGLHAAVGLNPKMLELKELRAQVLAGQLADGPQEDPHEPDFDRVSRWSAAAEALASRMEPTTAAAVGEQLVQRLENPKVNDRAVLTRLQGALTALAVRLEPATAANLAKRLETALGNREDRDTDRLQSLGAGLVALVKQLRPSGAERVADDIASTILSPEEINSDRLNELEKLLVDLAKYVEPEGVGRIAERFGRPLPDKPEAALHRQLVQATVLAKLAGRVEPTVAARVVAGSAQLLANRLVENRNPELVLSYSQPGFVIVEGQDAAAEALAGLATHMEPLAAAATAERLVRQMETSNRRHEPVVHMGTALAGMVVRMQPDAGATAAARGWDVLVKKSAGSVGELASAARYQFWWPNRIDPLPGALAALGRNLKPAAAAGAAKQLTDRMLDPKVAEADRLRGLQAVLTALASRLEPAAAAEVAHALLKALEEGPKVDPKGRNASEPVHPPPLGAGAPSAAASQENVEAVRRSCIWTVLAALAPRMEPRAAPGVLARGAVSLITVLSEPSGTELSALLNPVEVLESLAPSMSPITAAEIGRSLVEQLDGPQAAEANRVSSTGLALVAIAGRFDPGAAAEVATSLVRVLEGLPETDLARLSSVEAALAAVARQMEPTVAAASAKQGAQVLIRALENPNGSDPSRLQNLGATLSELAARIGPDTRKTRLLALSTMLLGDIPGPPGEGEEESAVRKGVVRICASLTPTDLVEVLKWPYCRGEAEKLVLAQLERKTSWRFNGDARTLVTLIQNRDLDVIDEEILKAPAQRPTPDSARQELDAIPTRPVVAP